MNLWEFFKSESLWTFDHIVWFDHREEWNIRCVDALRSDGSELKRYMMQVLEVYILAFALVFSCVSTFLVDFDAAENTIEVVQTFIVCSNKNIIPLHNRLFTIP